MSVCARHRLWTLPSTQSLVDNVSFLVTAFSRCSLLSVEHVKDYLGLSAKAGNDESVSRNIKALFEKKNQESARIISKLQV